MNVHLNNLAHIKKEPIELLSSDDDSKKVTETEQRTFYLAVLALLFSFASFAVSGFKVSTSSTHQMVVVDMNQLLRQKAADIVKQQSEKTSDSTMELKLVEQARHVRTLIEEYAAKNNVIVAAKGAVFGSNLKDVTHEISAQL